MLIITSPATPGSARVPELSQQDSVLCFTSPGHRRGFCFSPRVVGAGFPRPVSRLMLITILFKGKIMSSQPTIRLSLPSKGRLEIDALEFLAEAGLRVFKPNPRQYQAEVPALPELGIIFQRPGDIVVSVRQGREQRSSKV